MSKLKFDVAIADVEAAQEDRATLQLTLVEIAGEQYAAVRPAPGAFMEMLNLAHQVRAGVIDKAVGVLMFMNECLDEQVIRAALADSGDYEPTDDDPDAAEFSAAGERLALSNAHITARIRSHDDDLGVVTLADVMVGLLEEWSGNPTGLLPGSGSSRSRTGGSSTGRTAKKASTSRASASKARRGSSPRST